jgi:hypothetical protein
MIVPASALTYRPELKRLLDDVLDMPSVSAGTAFGYPCYRVFGRVFAFVGWGGLAFKLPPEQIEMLLHDARFRPFEPRPGLVWREWLAFEPVSPEECLAILPLLNDAIAYVIEKELVR